MKRILTTICFFIAAQCNNVHAQSMAVTKTGFFQQSIAIPDKEAVCYQSDLLQQISDEMFKSGNPKYIWIDLVKDRLVNVGDYKSYNIYIETKQKETGGNMQIPADVQQRYAEKLVLFLKKIEEPITEDGAYSLHLYQGIACTDITDKKSPLYTFSQQERNSIRMDHREDLRFLEMLLADGLATADITYNIDFSRNGFYVNKIRLSPEMSEKYSQLCLELYGTSYKESGSRMQMGPTADVTLGDKISSLRTKVLLAKHKPQTAE